LRNEEIYAGRKNRLGIAVFLLGESRRAATMIRDAFLFAKAIGNEGNPVEFLN